MAHRRPRGGGGRPDAVGSGECEHRDRLVITTRGLGRGNRDRAWARGPVCLPDLGCPRAGVGSTDQRPVQYSPTGDGRGLPPLGPSDAIKHRRRSPPCGTSTDLASVPRPSILAEASIPNSPGSSGGGGAMFVTFKATTAEVLMRPWESIARAATQCSPSGTWCCPTPGDRAWSYRTMPRCGTARRRIQVWLSLNWA